MVAKTPRPQGSQKALRRAIQTLKGGKSELARITGVTRQGIQKWKSAPAEYVLAIEKATGVSRHDLRPDIYPIE